MIASNVAYQALLPGDTMRFVIAAPPPSWATSPPRKAPAPCVATSPATPAP